MLSLFKALQFLKARRGERRAKQISVTQIGQNTAKSMKTRRKYVNVIVLNSCPPVNQMWHWVMPPAVAIGIAHETPWACSYKPIRRTQETLMDNIITGGVNRPELHSKSNYALFGTVQKPIKILKRIHISDRYWSVGLRVVMQLSGFVPVPLGAKI